MSTWAALPTELKLIILNKVLLTIVDEMINDYHSGGSRPYERLNVTTLQFTALLQVFPEMQSYLFSLWTKELEITEVLRDALVETLLKKYKVRRLDIVWGTSRWEQIDHDSLGALKCILAALYWLLDN